MKTKFQKEFESLNAYTIAACVDIAEIKKFVACFFEIQKQELQSRSRKTAYLVPRQIAMWLRAKKNTEKVGRPCYTYMKNDFVGFAATTIRHAAETIETRIEVEPAFRRKIEFLLGEWRETNKTVGECKKK